MAGWFLLLAALLASLVFVADGINHHKTPPHERVLHHYGELMQAVTEMKSSSLANLPAMLNTTGSNPLNISSNMTSDVISTMILRSLLSSCLSIRNDGYGSSTNINIFNNSSINLSLKSKKSKGEKPKVTKKRPSDITGKRPSDVTEKQAEEEQRLWPNGIVRPTNLNVRREGDMVRVTFDVFRSEPATVDHAWTFEGERKYLEDSSETGMPVLSSVDFVVNASQCPPVVSTAANARRERFAFSKKGNDMDRVFVELPTCFLYALAGFREVDDHGDSETFNVNSGQIHWNEPVDNYAQKLEYPLFLQQLGNATVRIVPGENVTFDVDIQLGHKDSLLIEIVFYNATNQSMHVSNGAYISAYDDDINVQDIRGPEQVNLLEVRVLEEKKVEGKIPGINDTSGSKGDDSAYMLVTLRLIVKVAEGNVSGIMNLQHERQVPVEPEIDSRLLVLSVIKGIQIMSANQTRALPERKFLTHLKKKFQCGDRGFSFHQGYGNNCTFFCSITGLGVKHIRVKKIGRGITPVQKYAEVNSDNSFLMVNLGPTRKALDGEYECRAIVQDGKQVRWKVAVRTWGFPKVTEHSLDVDNELSTSNFTCVGQGERGLEVAVFLTGRERAMMRLDDNPNVTRTLSQTGNETRMVLTIPSSFLRWPYQQIFCEIRNAAGEDSSSELLSVSTLPHFYFQTDHPYILRNQSSVTDNRDGSTTVECMATGKPPMKMDFYIDHVEEDNLVQENSMNSLRHKQEDNQLSSRLTLPTSALTWPKDAVICQASNDVGKSDIRFTLSDAIVNYYN